MPKVFVVQTFPDERRIMSDLLISNGYDVQPFYTDSAALADFKDAVVSQKEPFVVVSSQRDMRKRDDIGNFVHDRVSALKIPTLTVVYARAVADPKFLEILQRMKSTSSHGLVLVPKSSHAVCPMDESSILEREKVKSHIQDFFASLRQPA